MKYSPFLILSISILLLCVLSVQSMRWFAKQQEQVQVQEPHQHRHHHHDSHDQGIKIKSIPDLQDIEVPLTAAPDSTFEQINRAIRKVTHTNVNADNRESEDEAEEDDYDVEDGNTWKDVLKDSAESIKEKGSEVIRQAKDKANEWTEKVKDTVHGTSDTLKEKKDQLKEKSSHWKDALKAKGDKAADKGFKLKEDLKSRADSYFSSPPSPDADEDKAAFWKQSAHARSFSLNEWYDRLMTEIQKVFTSEPFFSDLHDPSSASLSLGAGLEWRHSDSDYTLSVDLAGIPMERICVTLTAPDRLEIHVIESTTTKKKSSTRMTKPVSDADLEVLLDHHHHRSMNRSIRLPSDIQVDSISAYYKDGLLLVKLPRLVAKPMNIAVQSLF